MFLVLHLQLKDLAVKENINNLTEEDNKKIKKLLSIGNLHKECIIDSELINSGKHSYLSQYVFIKMN